MKRPLARIGSDAAAVIFRRRSAMLLATASAVALLCPVAAAAAVCGAAPPADAASPAALFETLRERTDAQLLAMAFAQRPAPDCAWVYEVKVLTASGSVVELDFAAQGLGLIGARGPENDKEVARLVRGLGGNPGTIVTGGAKDGGSGADGSGSGNSGSGSGSSGGGDGDGGGEGGNSGSGSGGGEGGDSGGGEGGSDGGSGEGGDD